MSLHKCLKTTEKGTKQIQKPHKTTQVTEKHQINHEKTTN